MHDQSMKLMRGFADLAFHDIGHLGTVLDIGSGDVNGNYRELWTGWDYVGVDLTPGPNVDRVVDESGQWSIGRVVDAVISGQCLEHSRRPWVLAKTMGDHLRVGGLMCMIAPFAWPEHKHPLDCWRIAPDGMRELLDIAGCNVVAASLHDAGTLNGHTLADCIGIGRKRG